MTINSNSSLNQKPIATIMLTFRGGNESRAKNLIYIVNTLVKLNDIEIIVIEQDVRSTSIQHDLSENCKHEFVFNDKAFNKSWGMNIAAKLASGKALVVHDADILVDVQALIRAINDVVDGYHFINPYNNLIDLSKQESEYLVCGGTDLRITRLHDQLNRNDKNQSPPICGGVFVISKDYYFEIGGMDERFSGWGGEDDAMTIRALYHQGKHKTAENSTAYHLWHENKTDESNPNQYIRNLTILSAYRENSDLLLPKFNSDIDWIADKNKYIVRTNRSQPLVSPLISCLCVTFNRVELLKRAIHCFNAQTYVSKELVIICESNDVDTIKFLEQLDGHNISYEIIDIHPKKTLGELRNIALGYAKGSYFCQWDDDDFYHPNRLSRQLYFCQQFQKAASILPRWVIYSDQTKQAYLSNIRLWEGSILCKSDFVESDDPYLPISRGEESALMNELIVKDDVAIIDSPELYIYSHSGNNTWSDGHFENIFNASTVLDPTKRCLIENLLQSYDVVDSNQQIPKIIHQTHHFQLENLPNQLKIYQASIEKTNSQWQYEYYDDAESRQFISRHMPNFLCVYDDLHLAVQQADLFRLIVIYVKGGFYLDLDIELIKPLDKLTEYACVFAEEVFLNNATRDKLGHRHSTRIANYMFGAAPRNEFIGYLIQQYMSKIPFEIQSEDDVLDNTGPGMVTDAYFNYPNIDEIKLIKNDENYCKRCQQYSCHFGGYAQHHHLGSWRWTPTPEKSKIIHQTWKSNEIPNRFQGFCQSWQQIHPGWEYRLWTDDDNRTLIQTEFPWFLETYDAYPHAIQRADAARYFILYKFGGLYVDIDFKCLKSIESLVQTSDLVFGLEHPLHCQFHDMDSIIGNAFIFAKFPRHPFLKQVVGSLKTFSQAEDKNKNSYILKSTGPLMITEVYKQYENKQSVKLLPNQYLYPLDYECANEMLSNPISSKNENQLVDAFAIHFHAGSWWN